MSESSSADGRRLTVRGLLNEALMTAAKVVAGESHLDAELNWVLPLNEVLPQPDPLSSVAIYTRPEALLGNAGALTALSARGATALIVDGALPADFRHAGLTDGLVVIELAFPVGFAALNRLLAERTLSHEVHVMRYATHVHGSLAGLFHRGAGLEILVREVSNLSRNPALALDTKGNVVAYNGLPADSVDQLAEPTIGLLTTDVPAAERRPGHHTRVGTVAGPHASHWTCVASAIHLGKTLEGWVVILVPGPRPGDHDLDRHIIVTEQATAIVGSEMLRQRSVDEAEERARGDFVQALVHGSFSSEHDMRARAEHHDIDLDSQFGVFVAPAVVPTAIDNPAAAMIRLARYAAGVAPHPSVNTYVTVIGDVLVVVRTLHSPPGAATDKEMAEYAQAMSAELESRLGHPAPVAHSRPARGAAAVRESYRESRVALGIARRLRYTGATAYQELRGFTVLAQVADTDQGRQLVREVLEPLRTAPDLGETLIAYLAQGGNINAAARTLHVHRNTMLAKLDRISRLMGVDIRMPEHQFTAWLAIRLDLLAEVHAAVDREATFR